MGRRGGWATAGGGYFGAAKMIQCRAGGGG
jgi:hypothetical protein